MKKQIMLNFFFFNSNNNFQDKAGLVSLAFQKTPSHSTTFKVVQASGNQRERKITLFFFRNYIAQFRGVLEKQAVDN
jgi:hypothetical protein